MAPRKPVAERPNSAPAARPRSVALPPPVASGRTDMTMTPTVAIRMAIAIGNVTTSPSSTNPNSATWTGSVLMYAMVTMKERSFMAASMRAVAAICVSAPSTTQGQNIQPGRGRPEPDIIVTAVSERSTKGNPNRKRTCVAPTVPRLAVSSRCMALRTVWANAAIRVKPAHSQPESLTMSRRPLGHDHVVHVDIVGELHLPGEDIQDHAALIHDLEPVLLQCGLQLVRPHQLVPMVRPARQKPENVFGADDRQGEALERAVDGGDDHQAAGLDHFGAAPDEQVHVGDVLDHLHGEHDIEALAGVGQHLGGDGAVVDVESRAGGVTLGHLDAGLGRIGAHDGSTDARERLRQDAGAAADIEDTQTAQAIERFRIAPEVPAGGVADVAEPHRVDHVQRSHRAVRIPPGLRQRVEMRDLGRVRRAVLPRFAFHALPYPGAVATPRPRRYVYRRFCRGASFSKTARRLVSTELKCPHGPPGDEIRRKLGRRYRVHPQRRAPRQARSRSRPRRRRRRLRHGGQD